jgi:LCP family protein required for cell wall assembly
VIGVLAVVALSLGLLVGRIANAALTIGGNLAAMQVTAAPTRPAATPTLALPTALAPLVVEPTTTPQPAAGVLDASPPLLDTPDAGLPVGALGGPAVVTSTPRAVAPTAIKLPSIGAAPIPTLMPTYGVLPASGAAVNILLLGSDRRPGESWQTRSDAIIIAHLDPARQRIALLSLPRDLVVNIPGYGYSRINAATVYGDMVPELGGGSELARATVSDLLGIPIDHVVRIDFSAFITAINAIGGIDLVVENELYDGEYPTMDYGYTVAHFFPGPQHLDGETALMYARLRHADSDYHRARRQQQVIQAAMQRVRDQNILGQIDMLADLSSALRDNIQTDLSLDQMIGIAWAFRNYSPDQIERYGLDENLTSSGLPGDQYAITAAPGAISLVVGQLLGQ